MTFASRPPALPDDLAAIAELSARSEALDQLDYPADAEALAGLLARPGLDQARDVRLWQDERGGLAAFAVLNHQPGERQVDGMLWLRVRPELRGDAIADAAVAWAAARLRQVGAECGLPTQLASGAGGADAWRAAMLERLGFRPTRYFLRMERGLAGALEPPRLPAGFTLRPVAGEHEAEAWTELFNQSFVDHWNHHPLSVELLRSIWAEPIYRRELDLVVVAPDGALAAFCACDARPDAPEGAGWIEVLGTRRGYRGLGLGRAALQAGLLALREAGMGLARLTVDAESPTGATRLYEAAGFRETRRSVRLARPPEEREGG